MNLDQLREQASKETRSVSSYITRIQQLREKYPLGTDFPLYMSYVKEVEIFCDLHDIPFLHIYGDTCSTAGTYAELVAHEERR